MGVLSNLGRQCPSNECVNDRWHGFSPSNDFLMVRCHGSCLEKLSVSISKPSSGRCLQGLASEVQWLVFPCGSQASDVFQVLRGHRA